MRALHRVAALLLLLLPATGWAETHAVLIGIDTYDNPDVTALRYTVNDVRAFYDLLVDPAYGGAKPENVVLMVPEAERGLRPTRAGILLQIKKAALRTRADDSLILYFAGHGMETAEGRFLLGIDTDPLLLSDTAVPVDRLPAILADVSASKILVIVDACRNDPASGRAQADNPMGEAFERGLRPRVLAPDAGGGPRQVATWLACGVGQRAWEYSQHEHGVFSYYLLEGLKGGAATDGDVSLTTLAAHVANSVAEWARQNGKQQDPKLDNPDRLDLVLTRPHRPRPGGVQEIPLGTLRVESEPPGASVIVDDQPKGKTPCDVTIPLPDGQRKQVTVRLELEGYEPAAAGAWLVPGETQSWSKTLTRKSAPVIQNEPPTVTPEQRPPDQPVQQRPSSWLPGWEVGPDGLPVVAVPGGPAMLGTDDPNADMTERPRHTVSLSPFKIHTVEVTNEAFAITLNRMMAQGAIHVDSDGNVVTNETGNGWPAGLVLIFTSSPTCAIKVAGARGGPVEPALLFSVDEAQHDLPAVPVTWFGAALYAAWNEMRLPTEAEWERAAQSRDANQPYPWGQDALSRARANVQLDDDPGALVEVGQLQDGASAVGCLQMVGNVWEWVADRYIPDYHRQAAGVDPQTGFSPGEVVEMSLRGGGYQYPAELSGIRTRSGAYAGDYGDDYGFRCVLPSQPTTNLFLPEVSTASLPGDDDHLPVGGVVTRQNDGTGAVIMRTDDDPPGGPAAEVIDGIATVAQFYSHPINGAQIAIPSGWQAMEQLNGAVAIGNGNGDDDGDGAGVLYYYCPPYINTPELAVAAIFADLRIVGVQLGQVTNTQVLTMATQTGVAQLFRQQMVISMDGEDGWAIVDIVAQNGILHGLVYVSPVDVYEAYLPMYRTVLERTVYP